MLNINKFLHKFTDKNDILKNTYNFMTVVAADAAMWGILGMKADKASVHLKGLKVFLLCFFAAMVLLPTAAAWAGESGKTVRVGWYDSSFNTEDRYGRRTGYAYEYQLKIGAYTGWNYEYVKGSWPELLQMLIDGDIDLMSDVSYTKERSELMLFPDLPMGQEEYYLFVSPGNREISSSDYSTINGKKIGVNKGSVQADFFLEWAERNGIRADLVELTTSEDESLNMIESGELDAYVTVDSFTDPDRAVPVVKVGASDFFFAVNRDCPDLLAELNTAMNRIREENRYYNQQMFEKYTRTSGSNAFLSADELDWLSAHGKIRVGCQDNYLAFCAKDRETGELTGALKDYLEYAAHCLKNADLEFETTIYPTVEAALEALRSGELDCVFPANLSGYDGEEMGVVMTQPVLNTDISAIVREADLNNFTNREYVIVAVNQGNPNYDAFLAENYPGWRKVYFDNTEECLEAVYNNVADCLLISSFRYNNISRLCEKYNLTTVPTAVGMDYCFATRKGDKELYSTLSKVVDQIPTSSVNSALSYYITEDARRGLRDFINDNLAAVLAAIAALVLVFVLLLLRSMRAEKRAKELICATETDQLTGLYNRDYFFQYANRMHTEKPETAMDAIVLNIDHFHLINEINGRDFGDRILSILGQGIKTFAKENGGIAGRFGADRFDIYCQHTEDYQTIYDSLQGKLDAVAPNAGVRLRMGVMPWQKELEPVQMFDRARTACGMARGHYHTHLVVFNEKVREHELYEQRLLGDLRRALESYEFEVYYQPKYDIQADPPKIVSVEALVRWIHPELGLIPPNDFIPLLERNGMIVDVDKYVWSEAARQVARWRAQFSITIPISVNLSRVDVFEPTLEETLDGILLNNGLGHEALMLEVTESAYTENADQVIRVVERLRAKGYTVEMDDFGTGYSSLNMLSSMPVDVLKMDRTFIQNIENDEKDIQLVALILGIANNLKISVVAEGVETESQLQLLKKLGCKVVQGYYFSRPLHPSEFESRILKNRI